MVAQPQGGTVSLPVIDVDLKSRTGWSEALAPMAGSGSRLVAGFNDQVEAVVGSVGLWAARRAIGALHTVMGSHYGEEVADIAGALGLSEAAVVMANVAYDLANIGCSTFIVPTARGPLHARNLDWSFPRGLLKEHLMVARMRNGRHGDYAIVGWPGMFGVLTGIAPERFSVTVNYVRNVGESTLSGALKRAVAGSWPVAWVVRQAFDEAKDFKSAVRILKEAELLAPVLFTVAGTENNERVVIERGCDTWAVRKADGLGAVCTTNHYVSSEFRDDNVDLMPKDTQERLAALSQTLGKSPVDTAEAAITLLSSDDLLRADTQHQVVMEPAIGRMTVAVPGGVPVTIEM